METKSLKKAYEEFRVDYPDYQRQINEGLLVALSGGVSLQGNAHRVVTPHTYWVRFQGRPVRWSCTCPQGASFGPVAGNFFGHPGRVCKHVAAVALCLEAMQYPGKPENLLAYISRIARVGCPDWLLELETYSDTKGFNLPNGGQVRVIPVIHSIVSIIGLELKLGHTQSKPIAWLGNEQVDKEAYREWAEQIKEKV